MVTQVIVTNAGLAALNDAIIADSNLNITKYSVGNTAGYTPLRTQTDISGTEVFNQDSAGAGGATLSIQRVGDYAFEFSLFLDGTVGDFTVGEYAFKDNAGTTIAIGVLGSTTTKTKSTSVVTGNSMRLRAVVSIANAGDTVSVTTSENLFNSIPVIATEASLPSALTNASANIYHIRNYNTTGFTAIAVKNIADNSWKIYVQTPVTVDNEVLLGKLSDKTVIGSGKIISNDSDFTTDAANKIPTKAAVESRISALVDSAPGALDTLNELAAALGDDANFATTVTNSLAGKLAIASNLSDLNNAATARSNIGITNRTAVSNANYTVLVTDKIVAQTGTMSTARTWSLPAASSYPTGEELTFIDESGTVNMANKVIIDADGSDTIDGADSIELNRRYGVIRLISNGTNWKISQNSLPNTQYYPSNENSIINGDMNFWLDNTGETPVDDNDHIATLLRWNQLNTVAVLNSTRSTDVPTIAQAGRLFNFSANLQVTTIDATIGAADYGLVTAFLEGNYLYPIAQKPMVCSFWVKAKKTGTYCIAFVNGGYDKSFVAEYTVDSVDTWEFKVITVDASPSAGTWDYTTGLGLEVRFSLAMGSNYQGTLGWQDGNISATSNQVNMFDSTDNYFRMTGLKLEEGYINTRFGFESPSLSLDKLQRHYEASTTDEHYKLSVASATQVCSQLVHFKTLKRANPAMTVTKNSGVANLGSTVIGTGAFRQSFTGNTNDIINFSWVADSRF